MRPSRREGRLYHDTSGRAVALIFSVAAIMHPICYAKNLSVIVRIHLKKTTQILPLDFQSLPIFF